MMAPIGRTGSRIILLGGPTASGKSALALALAKRLGGTIVNADSMQVYRELRVITARPSPEQEAAAPHRLFGGVSAASSYSVARWLADVGAALDTIAEEGRPAILVGGTGLYFRALTHGLAEHPPIPDEVRTAVRSRLVEEGPAALHAALLARDGATAAGIAPADGQRIARALEVLEATGRPLAAWRADAAPPRLVPERTLRLVVEPERAELHRRIAARLDAMIAAGALDEATRFQHLAVDPRLPAAKAIGLRPLMAAAAGEIGLTQALARAAAETRRYAKRQSTWFRTQAPGWRRLPQGAPDELAESLAAELG